MFKMISVGIVLNVLINIPHYYIPILLLHPNEKKQTDEQTTLLWKIQGLPL